ncbi:hypothetical protein WJX82_010504 [Trebouxia sp. C0006]
MASYKSIAVVAAILFVGATAQENTLAAVADLASNPSTAFVYVPQTSVTGEITTGADSVTSLRTATYWPALTGLGISQSAFTLAPCTLRSPHIHDRASGILYVSQADSLEVGFVNENGTSVNNTISTGASAVFPQGLIHYQYNSGCTNATYTISYGSELPGTQVVTQALLALPSDVLAAALGIEISAVALLNTQSGAIGSHSAELLSPY